MPTYEYVCQKCGHAFEKSQSIADKPLTICPKDLCGKAKWGKGRLKKLISAGVGLLFKGSGFYITDYRSDKYKEAAKKDVAPVAATAGDGKSGAAASGDSKSGSSGNSKSSSGGDSKSSSGGDSKSSSDRDRSSGSGGRGQTKPSSAKVESKPAKGGKSGS
jgi:putative FmdB family regulatory protein